jgi:hypothetical protein
MARKPSKFENKQRKSAAAVEAETEDSGPEVNTGALTKHKKEPAQAPATNRRVATSFPKGEYIVSLIDFKGQMFIATNVHVYILHGRQKNILRPMRFEISDVPMEPNI